MRPAGELDSTRAEFSARGLLACSVARNLVAQADHTMAVALNNIMVQVAARLSEGQFRRVTFFCGSILSRGTPCACLTVPEVRQRVMRALCASSGRSKELKQLLLSLSRDGSFNRPEGFRSPFEESFYNLPFEQFMGCLAATDAGAVKSLVQAAYGEGRHGTSNGNHKALAQIAAVALDRGMCEEVNILTTNYDLGLERAFEEMGLYLVPSEELRLAPGAPTLTSGACGLRLSKLHGTVADLDGPDSPVFTFDQIAQIMSDPHRFASLSVLLRNSQLVVFVGYGINDIDLRPPIAQGLQGCRAIAVWTERPPEGSSSRDGSLQQKLRGVSSARDRLRAECGILTYYADLMADPRDGGREGPLALLSAALGVDPPRWAPTEALSRDVERAVEESLSPLSAVDETASEKRVRFIGLLADSCAVDAARSVLRPYALGQAPSLRQDQHAALYLKTFGHGAKYEGAIAEVKELAKKGRPLRLKALAHTYAGLIHTFRREVGPAIRAFTRASILTVLCFGRVGRAERIRLADYWLHFVSRCVIESSNMLRASGPMGAASGWLLVRIAGAYVFLRYLPLLRKARRVSDLRLRAELLDMGAQAALLVGLRGKAEQWASEVQEIYEQLQDPNTIALSERLRAWVELSCPSASQLTDARRRLSRAVMLGFASTDTSLAPKFLANLVRVVRYEGHNPSDLLESPTTPGSRLGCAPRTALLNTCEFLMSEKTRLGTVACQECLAELVAGLKGRCKNEASWCTVRNKLIRYGDVRRYPILLV